MINRNIENNQLITNIHGSYTDYKLYMNHMISQIYKYLDKQFPYKDENNCFKSRYVDLVDIEYKKHTSDFIMELSSIKKLSKKDIDNICKEFNVLLIEVKTITRIYDYSLYNNNSKELIEELDNEVKTRSFNYRFTRQRIEWV